MKQLSSTVYVGNQIRTSDIDRLIKLGIRTIINNRPDGETPLQPDGHEIKAVAEAAGLQYKHVPMAGALTPDLIKAATKAFSTPLTPIFAYCASGTRSTALWCFANVKTLGVDGVLEVAAKAGYHLEQLRGPLSEFVAD